MQGLRLHVTRAVVVPNESDKGSFFELSVFVRWISELCTITGGQFRRRLIHLWGQCVEDMGQCCVLGCHGGVFCVLVPDTSVSSFDEFFRQQGRQSRIHHFQSRPVTCLNRSPSLMAGSTGVGGWGGGGGRRSSFG